MGREALRAEGVDRLELAEASAYRPILAAKFDDALLPMTLLSEQLVDLIVQISYPMLTQRHCHAQAREFAVRESNSGADGVLF